jgi:hypothetical protein
MTVRATGLAETFQEVRTGSTTRWDGSAETSKHSNCAGFLSNCLETMLYRPVRLRAPLACKRQHESLSTVSSGQSYYAQSMQKCRKLILAGKELS